MKATIATLKVDTSKPLDATTKRMLTEQINSEFQRQSTLFDSSLQESKRKIIEKYKKDVGFSKLMGEIRKAESTLEIALNNLAEVGLDKDGDIACSKTTDSLEKKSRIEKLRKTINDLSMSKPDSIRSKIITRLWLASTVGEAMVIVNEVMGNGLIPTLDTKQLEYKSE